MRRSRNKRLRIILTNLIQIYLLVNQIVKALIRPGQSNPPQFHNLKMFLANNLSRNDSQMLSQKWILSKS